ncbi:related to ABC-type Fe3+ transport system, periplasmic component [Ramularia collo-cygni]|uniref:Related to ABC-type Fe3+ transport system, periplasmic component n=1 Tax=Ramularia collo-cygni TaxID=112498 RepID=A0A2D3V750_9PEZI|nr:related to ABC-type Fe3+ transport system, periplasmic component [Ramularia collo-cygni]CZT17319.1 related to ABC-type Fe3+ transport system, periplasmic component [Ramularia collo-cygni]
MKSSGICRLLGVVASSASLAHALPHYSDVVEVESRSLDQIYAAAKQESGPLQVFWGGDAGSQGDGTRAAWAARFPDLPLNLTVDLSKYHNNRIDRAHLQGLHVADIANLQTLQDFPRWKAEGKLVKYKPANFEDILGSEKDFEGAYVPTGINSFGTFVYDSTKINASSVPRSYASLTDPMFKGKLIVTYPNDDDAVAYLFSLIVDRYGYQWLYDLAQNDVQWVRGTGSPMLLLNALHNSTSSRALSFTSYSNGQEWVGTKVPEAPEQYMSWAQTGAIIEGTPRPETSKLFISWLTSFQRQNSSHASGNTILKSLNTLHGADPFGNNATQISGFRRFEQDRAGVEWWKNLYEEVLGTPQGLGPLEVYPNA